MVAITKVKPGIKRELDGKITTLYPWVPKDQSPGPSGPGNVKVNPTKDFTGILSKIWELS